MFEYFYNEILRKTIISFGILFNGITIKQDGSTVKVPLAYGPTQKFLARLEQAPNLSQATQSVYLECLLSLLVLHMTHLER